MSFVKYRDSVKSNCRGQVFWQRANDLGAPFRGSQVPMLHQEEMDDQLERVYDAEVKVLNLSKPEDLAELRDINDKVANGWYAITHNERQFVPEEKTWYALIEYCIPYMEHNRPPS